jgi:hypothetical protein
MAHSGWCQSNFNKIRVILTDNSLRASVRAPVDAMDRRKWWSAVACSGLRSFQA